MSKIEKKTDIDSVDLELLVALQANGRLPNVELARRAQVSEPTSLRRVRALEEAGFIKGVHADIAASRVGFEVTVFAMVGLHSQAEADLQAFEALVSRWSVVRECHMLNGDIDFILKCVALDLASFQTFLTEQLTPAPNVAHVRTSLTIRQSKLAVGVPLEFLRDEPDS